MKHIPLHSLIIFISNTTDLSYKSVSQSEILTLEAISQWLSGENPQHHHYNFYIKELFHTVRAKLLIGERVIVCIPELRKRDRLSLANLGSNYGAPVFYIIDKNYQIDPKLEKYEKTLTTGDGVAEVIDLNAQELHLVQKLPTSNLYQKIKSKGFKGLTVVGDVHGVRESLKSAINWATSRNHFLIFLGDIVDYGPKPVECVNDIYDVIMAGRGALIYGNHERKIERWFEQTKTGDIKIKISDGNQVTIDAINRLSKWQKNLFENKYRALMAHARNHYCVQNIVFTHGAGHPDMFNLDEQRLSNKHLSTLALFGEVDTNEPIKNGLPNRIYSWVDLLSENQLVIVGHDIRSTDKPFVQKSVLGGEAVFLDTGSGKGGGLTSADIRFNQKLLKINNFNRH